MQTLLYIYKLYSVHLTENLLMLHPFAVICVTDTENIREKNKNNGFK